MDTACPDMAGSGQQALADIGRATLGIVGPPELGDRAAALIRGELPAGDARRTLNDLGLVAVALKAARLPGAAADSRTAGQ